MWTLWLRIGYVFVTQNSTVKAITILSNCPDSKGHMRKMEKQQDEKHQVSFREQIKKLKLIFFILSTF